MSNYDENDVTVAIYRDQKLPEYNANPMIQALPPNNVQEAVFEIRHYITKFFCGRKIA